jgi:ferredoxin-NADP reductase
MLTAVIDSIHRATPRSLVLRVALDGIFPFSAGQAAFVGECGRDARRPYSIAVAPHDAERSGRLEFLVGLGPDGTPGPHLPDPQAGATVEIEGPFGTFRYPDRIDEPAVLFVAGGTGIAPLRAMLHEALASDTPRQLSVLYSARNPEEFAFDEELASMAAGGRIQYQKTVTRHADESWSGERGRISRAQLESAIARPDTLCFVCGPEALVHQVPRVLRELGIDATRIRVEEWTTVPRAL